MSDVIKSLTAKIGADTSDFVNGIKKVDKEINITNKNVEQLKKGLELKFNASTFTTAQKQVQKALETTTAKAEAIREQLKLLESSGNINTDSYEKLTLELAKAEGQVTSLNKQIKDLNKIKLDSLKKEASETGEKISKIGKSLTGLSIASSAALAGLGALSKKTISYGAELDDLAQRSQISAESMQEWVYVAMQTGVETEQLSKAIIKVRGAYADMSTGISNSQTEVLGKLGIVANAYSSNEDLFNAVINQLAKIEDETTQVAFANELFGDRVANNLIPMLNAGDDAIKQLKDEFSSMSSLSNEQVSAMASLDDALYRLSEKFKNLGYQIGASFAPIIEKLAGFVEEKIIPIIEKFVAWFNKLDDTQKTFMVGLMALLAVGGPLLVVIGKISSAIGNLSGSLSGLHKILDMLKAHPIITVISVVIALLAAMYAKNEAFRESVNKLFSSLSKALYPILNLIGSALSTIFELLAPLINIIAEVLAPILDWFNTYILQPIVTAVEKIVNGLKKALDLGAKVFGKGWLWGKEDDTPQEKINTSNDRASYSIPDYSDFLNSNSSVYNNSSVSSNDSYNITVNVEGNEYMNTEELVSQISKKLAIKIQSRS